MKSKTIGIPVDGIVPVQCDNDDCQNVTASVTGDGEWPIEQGWRLLYVHALCPACGALEDAAEESESEMEMNN